MAELVDAHDSKSCFVRSESSILSSPTKNMQVDKINNLLELFYEQYKKQDKENIFLQSLREPKKKYSWKETYINIAKLSEEITKYIKKGDRCLLISENRHEWMI